MALPCSRALVVAPKTLLAHWAAELRACGLGRLVAEFYGGSVRERCASFRLHQHRRVHAQAVPSLANKEAVQLAIAGSHEAAARCEASGPQAEFAHCHG